jgi:spore coat polysaccharide biosynthesis protein SpsF
MTVRVAVIAQARMGSSRLPGKVLRAVGGRTVLAHVLSRAQMIEAADTVCCATSTDAADDAIAEEAAGIGVEVFRGSLDDVLDRYARAAAWLEAGVVMRVTCDCPLLDPAVCADVIRLRETEQVDYAANNFLPTWPHGLDCEVFTRAALQRAEANALAPYEREHVTPWIRNSPELSKANLDGPGGKVASMRWTLDYPEDLQFLEVLSRHCDLSTTTRWQDIAAVIDRNPGILAINRNRQLDRSGAPAQVASRKAPVRAGKKNENS